MHKLRLVRLIGSAVSRGLKEGCGTFLLTVCDEYNAYISHYLRHIRASNRRFRIKVLAPNHERELSSLALRSAAQQIVAMTDEAIQIPQPVEDHPLNLALYCDSLKICDYGNKEFLKELIEDIAYMHVPCHTEIVSE